MKLDTYPLVVVSALDFFRTSLADSLMIPVPMLALPLLMELPFSAKPAALAFLFFALTMIDQSYCNLVVSIDKEGNF